MSDFSEETLAGAADDLVGCVALAPCLFPESCIFLPGAAIGTQTSRALSIIA